MNLFKLIKLYVKNHINIFFIIQFQFIKDIKNYVLWNEFETHYKGSFINI